MQGDISLLVDVIESYWNKLIEIYEIVSAHFFTAPGLVWQARLKKAEAVLELLTDVVMLRMVGKRIRGGMSHTIHRYAKANNKYMKYCDQNKESSCLMYCNVKN